jgi:hypothetical protein
VVVFAATVQASVRNKANELWKVTPKKKKQD